MVRTTLPRRAWLAGAAGAAALALAAGCGGDAAGPTDGAPGAAPTTSGPATDAAFNDADVAFAQNMIAHHQSAIEMARMAATQASDAETKQLATQFVTTSEQEIQTMTGWLSAWGRPVTPDGGHEGMAMPGMMSEAEMRQMHSATGADFDRQFCRAMISHHNGAVQMAEEQRTNGSNAEAKALAATIADSQAAEAAALEKILDRL